MSSCSTYKLKEAVEEYCLMQFNDRRKHFINYMRFAKFAWREIFVETLKTVTSEWVCLEVNEHGIKTAKLPKTNRLVSIQYVKDGKFVKLYENTEQVPVNSTKVCGCKSNCDCGTMCSTARTSSFSSKEVTIDNVSYYERTWREMASNGDIVEIRKIPTKQYNTSNNTYTVTTIEQKKRICNLKLKECGCVENSKENAAAMLLVGMNEEVVQYETGYKILTFTGVSGATYQNDVLINATEIHFAREGILKQANQLVDSYQFDPSTGTLTFIPNIAGTERGFVFYKTNVAEKIAVRTPYVQSASSSSEEVESNQHCEKTTQTDVTPGYQFSDCGNKISVYNLDVDEILITHQMAEVADESPVPWEALKVLLAGIDYYSVVYNRKISPVEKQQARIHYRAEITNLVMFLNPIDEDFVANLSNQQKQW